MCERSGCDTAPLDSATEEGRLTLLSYLWPDQPERLERLDAAIALARVVPASVERAEADEWLEARLGERANGVTTVVFHSIVVEYLDDAARQRINAALERAAEKASVRAPLARLSMEPAGEVAEIRLTTWPEGHERLLARAGYHGSPLTWVAGRGSLRGT